MSDTEDDSKGTALVTGGSRGIGYELARLFAGTGYDVVLVARSEGDLEDNAAEFEERFGIEATPIAMDLARPEAPEELYEETQDRGIQVDVLVNNAGFGGQGAFVDTDLDRELDMIQLNVTTVTHLTKLYLREMDERGHGKVLNVASGAAFQPGPYMGVYYATKAYVLSFTEAIAEETDDDIAVSTLCPGPVDTGFQDRADTEESLLNVFDRDAEWVARRGYRGLMNDETVVIPGIEMKASSLLVRATPRSINRKVAGILNREY